MNEAYSLIAGLLDSVETDRRGKTYEEDVRAAYADRMLLNPYPGGWNGMEARVAYSEMKGGRTTWLFNDGAIRVTRDTKSGHRITEFWKYGAGLLRGTVPAGKQG
jgi:hypothetical protein